jgi:integrase
MSKRRRQRSVGCSVGERPDGTLRLRFRWQGHAKSIATGLASTPEILARLQLLTELVGKCIKFGKDPKPIILESIAASGSTTRASRLEAGVTVGDYYAAWIAQQSPPLVRKAQARDYRRHVSRYVLPRLGHLPLAMLKPSDVRGLQAELLSRGLSVRYVKNILAGSFRAMVRQAMVDEEAIRDPFTGLRWPKPKIPEPDPFTPHERVQILEWFRQRLFRFSTGHQRGLRVHAPYAGFVHVLFWTGLRPSEAAGLQWRDVDLEGARLQVRRSRHLWEYGDPKTDSARRGVELFPETVQLLSQLQPLRVQPEMPVFTNTRGQPIEPNSLLPHWYACQRALSVRVRGLYCTKDTFVTTALNAGVKIAWLENQTGVNYATLRRHYGKWLPTEGESELRRFAALDPTLFGMPGCVRSPGSTDTRRVRLRKHERSKVRKGGLEPPRVFSPQDPESCASANSATFARGNS